MVTDCPLIRYDETCKPDNGGCLHEGDYADCKIYKAWKEFQLLTNKASSEGRVGMRPLECEKYIYSGVLYNPNDVCLSCTKAKSDGGCKEGMK